MLGQHPSYLQQHRGRQQRLRPDSATTMAVAAMRARARALAAAASAASRPGALGARARMSSAAAAAAAAAAGDAGAADGAGDAGDGGERPHELVEWVLAKGGRVSAAVAPANLAGRDGGSGWGLKATRAVRAGERLVELPPGAMLTYGDGGAAAGQSNQTDPALLALIARVPEELWGGRLALALLAERAKGPASPFAAYVAALPRGFPGVPMFFAREALEAIDYPPVVEQVKRRCRWLARFAGTELAPLAAAGSGGEGGGVGSGQGPFGGAVVDVNALGWGLAAVTSRAFRVRGPSHPAALLPLIDMCNHSFEPNAEVVPAAKDGGGAGGGGVVMVAKRDVAAGEPLLLSYGPLSNDFLLMVRAGEYRGGCEGVCVCWQRAYVATTRRTAHQRIAQTRP